MARTDGLYIESVTLGGIPDGGDVEFEVVTPAGAPVSKVALTVSGSQTSVDLSTEDVASWPNEIRLKLNATQGDAFKTVNVRNSLGMVEFIRDFVPTSEPVLTGMGVTLLGSAHTFTWSDPDAADGRLYQIAINGITKAGTVTAPATQWYVTGLPEDGSIINVKLTWWDNNDISSSQFVTGTVTAYTASTGNGTQFIIPAGSISEGNYTSVDWVEAINPLTPIFWEANGNSVTTVSTVANRQSLGVRLDGTRTPSTRAGAGAYLVPSQTGTLEQWVYFDAGFDWGGTNEGGKLGFGLAGGSRKAGGLAGPSDPETQTGFTSRFMWRTGGSLYAYVYEANTVGYGDDYSLGVTAARGQWIKMKMEVQMNSAAGVADGILKAWVNDVLRITQTNIEWFGQGTPQIDALTLFVFHGGDDATWTPSRVNHVYFTDIYWALDNETLPNEPPVLLTPSSGYVATSPSVYFSWAGSPGYVYDLHVYSDVARTQKVVSTSGVVFDTQGIGTATSHTFTSDPSDGAQRYVRLLWWPNDSYTNGGYIDAQYTAYSAGLSLISPPLSGYVASSGDVTFEWLDPNKNAVYHLIIYTDAGRSTIARDASGGLMETYIYTNFESHTFTNDRLDGGARYGRLYQWADNSYDINTRINIDFEYTAFYEETVGGGPDYDSVKALTDSMWPHNVNQFTRFPMYTEDGYFAQALLIGCAQYFKVTGDTEKLDRGIIIGQRWIDSGVDQNGDGILDWLTPPEPAATYRPSGIPTYNYYHHEFKAACGLGDVLIEMQRSGYQMGDANRIANWRNFLITHMFDKFADGHNQVCEIASKLYTTSPNYNENVGRIAIVVMALDKTDPTPGNNRFHDWLQNRLGLFQTEYINGHQNLGRRWVEMFIDRVNNPAADSRGVDGQMDTAHLFNIIYATLRAKQIGYTIGNNFDEWATVFEAHLNDIWFPTAAGWTEYSNGTGVQNSYGGSATLAMSLSAGISPSLKARWVDHVLNYQPTFSFYGPTGFNQWHAVAQGGALMWVLNGGTL